MSRASASQGERAFVAAAGAEAVDPNIRDQIDYETQGVVRRNEGFVDRVLSFGGCARRDRAARSRKRKQRRLAEQEAIRRATGGGQVTIQRNARRLQAAGHLSPDAARAWGSIAATASSQLRLLGVAGAVRVSATRANCRGRRPSRSATGCRWW